MSKIAWRLILQDMETTIRRLHAEGGISTDAAGELLLTLGGPRLLAHPDEEDNEVDDQTSWRDHHGDVWSLEGTWRDVNGDWWRWAGGFAWEPDKQPMLSRTDYSAQDIALCRVNAVVGPLSPA